ncbi:TPA: hypothetical protein J1492_004308 [Escherichia coli]|uniref:hypothetical protein n=1 Tax=Escherichia coli TaxID=562 RepID=UPI001B285761|nr:hypothetical protein [Escherichia coli]HBA6806363.1 hypothetical protein [Escherichia coli]HBA7664201.1 hypothetical protein [Escherichia coli]HBA8432071.1 hypothetical protein [Escherichia coli]HBA8436679.1 hypothetical protein [Escherichia coli]HBA9822746.1 hypothetical protein [Escherichia coli]
MNEHTSSSENGENTPVSEIIRQKQLETKERLRAELEKIRNTNPKPQLMPPEKFALDDFVTQYPRRRKATRSSPPG